MSLFGTSPEDSSGTGFGQGRSSLFSDESGTGANASSSLFADDDFGSKSLWSSSNTKRAARHELVKTLLADTDVPDSYIDTYDLVLSAGNGVGSGIGLTAVREILAGSGLNATDQAKILNLIVPSENSHSDNLGRPEFNVLLALIGLAREGEDITFDAVDERRKNLPEPKSSYFDRLKANDGSAPSQERPTTPSTRANPVQEPSSDQSQFSRRDSMGGLESDPWGSPQRTRDGAGPALNGYGSMRSTMNAWSSRLPEENNENEVPNGHVAGNVTAGTVSSTVDSGWGDYSNTSTSAFEAPDQTGFGGFGPPGDDQGNSSSQARQLGAERTTGPQPVEEIKVTLLPEKEGVFLFQHRNYEVKWTRRGSTVVRRYSDFVWLLDCLHKRYPFRQLPLLPPKRVSVNGTHLAADSNSFLEKRRRGLVRFVNALARHPVLSQEQLVVMFLTVPTELSVWRKQATVSVQDEFTGRVLPPELEDSLPSNLSDTLDTVRNGVKRSAEIYINLCMLLERLSKRNEGLAADNLRFSLALQSLTEVTRDTYAIDTNDVPMLNEGISSTAKHLATSQTLLEDEARAWNEGVLEDLKLQRDWLVSMRELFDRRDRYAKNNIPQLERRIENNEKKLQDLRARPEGTVKPGDIEKVEEAIFKAKESIVQQHARGVFIKECMLQELIYFQQSQYQISHLHQDWSQERVKYAELQADNWRRLTDAVEGMPTGSE